MFDNYDSFLAAEKIGEPYYFGLGFIKCRISKDESMNFYVSSLAATVGEEEVHDHRYDFVSTIVAGTLTNEVFHCPKLTVSAYEVWGATCVEGEEETKLFDTTPTYVGTFTMNAGSRYEIQRDTFHRVSPGKDGAVTYLKRGPIDKQLARVVRPKGAAKTCPYAKKYESRELYEMIERLYANLN